jgi:hypothetical protein
MAMRLRFARWRRRHANLLNLTTVRQGDLTRQRRGISEGLAQNGSYAFPQAIFHNSSNLLFGETGTQSLGTKL